MRTRACRKPRLQAANIVAFLTAFAIVAIIATGASYLSQSIENIKFETEQAWRSQARTTLAYLRDKFMIDYGQGEVDPHSDASLLEWCKENLSGVRNGGATSDGFMIELGREIFISDDSEDCAKDVLIFTRTMSDEPLTHKDQEQAEIALNAMRQGNDTQYGDNNFWIFDNSPELLEWIIIPDSGIGLDGEPMIIGGTKNRDYEGLLIQLGTQTDEIMKPYDREIERLEDTLHFLHIIGILSVMQPIAYMLYFMIEMRHCWVED